MLDEEATGSKLDDDEAVEAVITDPDEETCAMPDVVVADIAIDELEVVAWYVLDAETVC